MVIKMNINAFLETLLIAAKGMLGIFAVTIVIIACIVLLNKFTGK